MIKKQIWCLLLEFKGDSFTDQYNKIKDINNEKQLSDPLAKLLLHAHKNVPFYTQRLEKANIINNGTVNLNEFRRLTSLTRDDIRENMNNLTSQDINKRKWFYNSTSGSTGEPVSFIQDALDNKWRRATYRYYYENIVGIDIFAVKKVLLSGSGSAFFESPGLRIKVNRWLMNTKFLNSFYMNEKDMVEYLKVINSHQPDLIRGDASSLYELCNFIERKEKAIHQPKVVISEAERLRREMREKVEDVFGTKVYDFYGSREVHGIAGECKEGLLHIFMFNNYVEVLDEQNHPVKEGEEGKIVVTNLHNYSMPLIRYEIGDMAILGPKRCKCGNPFPTLKEIRGRMFNYFIKEDGSLIHGGGFDYLFHKHIKDWINSFQIIQEDYRKIRILIAQRGNIDNKEQREIEKKIKIVMGNNCDVIWELVDEIPRSQSGKYLFAKSLLSH